MENVATNSQETPRISDRKDSDRLEMVSNEERDRLRILGEEERD